MHYKIILCEKKLNKFIDFLPELNNHECYYFTLFARNKYLNSDEKLALNNLTLKRFTVFKKEHIKNRIEQLEVKKGLYLDKNNKSIPEECLALYMGINPKNLELAQNKMAIELFNSCMVNKIVNLNSLAHTLIHNSSKNKKFTDFDFDFENNQDKQELFLKTVNELKKVINIEAFNILVTKNGLHVLVEHDKVKIEYKKSWYLKLGALENCDVRGDNLIPVAGCTQGGFSPYLLKSGEIF